MVSVEKEYIFEGPNGPTSLRDLFDGRPQLIIYHFMFDPDWDEGCKGCSYFADNFVGSLVHLAARNTSFAVISRAPLSKIEEFKKRMGWRFPWVSSFGNDFNYDFQVTLDPARLRVQLHERGSAPESGQNLDAKGRVAGPERVLSRERQYLSQLLELPPRH
jgi:predicted dithiol-disulfide oxidoreductase (DUF899 family)